MPNRLLVAVGVAVLAAGVCAGQDGYISGLFGKGKKPAPPVDADAPHPDGRQQVPSEYLLSSKNGPFHIFVASYVGERGVDFAVRLAADLRKLGFEAYVHNHHESEPFYRPNAKEMDELRKLYGRTPRFPQLKTPIQDNWVVLVGNFAAIENDRAFDATMNKLKKLNRESFSQPVAVELRWGTEANKKDRNHLIGLRGAANPLRPKEQKFDENTLKTLKLIKEMNDPEPYSVYQLHKPYSLLVYQFTSGAGIVKNQEKSFFSLGKKQQSEKLAAAADNARILCKLLRDMGEEAYIFHSDVASVVYVNGYDGRDDPRWVKDFDKYSKMKVLNGSIELKPSFATTPRDPAPVLNAN